jgi:2-dehydro-3-deoxy-D-arabinonate dehydratase
VGYTLANDVSAWDIERENPLYLPQSKIFRGCCAFGPTILTADPGIDPLKITIRCTIERAGRTVFEGEASTDRLQRSFGELIEYLTRDNPVPPGTLLLTGTGIIVPPEWALQPGDVVVIEAQDIGRIANPVVGAGLKPVHTHMSLVDHAPPSDQSRPCTH